MRRIAPRARAISHIVLVCLTLAGLDGWHSWHTREAALRDMRSDAASLARNAAQHADDVFTLVNVVLQGVQQSIAIHGIKPDAMPALQQQLQMRANTLSQIKVLNVYDPQGELLAYSVDNPLSMASVSDREYMQFHRAHIDPGMHIGPPIVSRSTGALIIPVSMRFSDAYGRLKGVILAGVSIDNFRAYYDSLQLGGHGTISMYAPDGTLAVKHPFRQEEVGITRAKELANGIERHFSYQHLAHYPITLVAGLSQSDALQGWWRDTLLHAAVMLIIIAVISLQGWRMIRQDQAIKHTLRRQALVDELTGLANRRQFDQSLAREMAGASRPTLPLGLILFDVDYFKQYNDVYGHIAGDNCLREISRLIRGAIKRPGDLVARYGGEEIAVLLPGTDAAGALSMAEGIRQVISDARIPHAGSPFGIITLSAGAHAELPSARHDRADTLLMAVDTALYTAKRQGRNQSCRAEESESPPPSRPYGGESTIQA